MTFILHRIRAWRLPKLLLYALGGLCLALSLFSAKTAWQNGGPGREDTILLTGHITDFNQANFKTSKILKFRFAEFCAEFVTIKFEALDYAALTADYAAHKEDLPLHFAALKTDSASIASCRTVELFSLASDSVVYLSLAERNESALSARRLVAGGITGLLMLAGLLALVAGSVSLKESDSSTEIWERRNISRR